MDGKWKWPLVLLLFVCSLPQMLWYKLFPPEPSDTEKRLREQNERALRERQAHVNDLPVTAEEDEAWNQLEKRQ